MTRQRLWMIAGLGNPGETYAITRHNAGFWVVDELADANDILLNKRKFDAVFGRGSIEGVETVLVKPMAFMNRSGPPVRRIFDYFKISSGEMVVVHDDIDLALGRLKIKEKGGDGGHKGLRSIIETFGGGDFPRLRIGIGRGAVETGVVDYVLGTFTPEEKKVLDRVLNRARDAVKTLICSGITEAMNRFNDRRVNAIS